MEVKYTPLKYSPTQLPEWQIIKSKRVKTPNFVEHIEQLELSYIGSRNVKLYQHFGKLSVSKKLKHVSIPCIDSKEIKTFAYKKLRTKNSLY